MTATTADYAYDSLRNLVVRGELKPGQRVSQLKLARRFRCSPAPVVEAMRRLQSEGLLVKKPRKMAQVRALSAADLEGLYMVREGLEAATSRLCALRITEEQIAQLQQLNLAYERALATPDRGETDSLDVAIHKLIADAARCPLLAEELDRLLLIERTAGTIPDEHYTPSSYSSHRALIQAIADRDADLAQYMMKKHIQAGYEELAG